MRVRITNSKAPWPGDARVGAVVELEGEVMPSWAVGKCVTAGDAPVTEQSQLDALAKHHEVAVSALQQDVAEAQAERDEAKADLAAEQARSANLAAKLAEASADRAAAEKAATGAAADLKAALADATALKAKLAEAQTPKADSKAKAK